MKINRFKNNLSSIELTKIIDFLKKGHLAKGIEIDYFESKLSKYLKINNVCVVSNGFSALFLSLTAIGVKKNDVVVMPAISTCHAVRNAITATGAKPLYIDTLKNLPIGDYSNSKLSNTKIKAIVSINHFGINDHPKNYNSNIPIIEDSSQCFGLKSSKKNVICSITSLYFSKVLNAIDGGVIFSHSKSFINKCKDLRSYDNKFDEVQRFNFKINNINAAFGISQLEKLNDDIDRRKIIANKYIRALEKSKLIDLDIYRHIKLYYKFPILFLKDIKIQKVLDNLENLEIPITPELAFNSVDKFSYPNSSSLVKRFYSIPCYPALSDKEVDYIIKCLKKTM